LEKTSIIGFSLKIIIAMLFESLKMKGRKRKESRKVRESLVTYFSSPAVKLKQLFLSPINFFSPHKNIIHSFIQFVSKFEMHSKGSSHKLSTMANRSRIPSLFISMFATFATIYVAGRFFFTSFQIQSITATFLFYVVNLNSPFQIVARR
jgi:hypothetical protein